MAAAGCEEVRAGLAVNLDRLWRYAFVLAQRRDLAEDLVQATCLRALERAHQFAPGTRLQSWLLAILRGIWFDELRAQRVRLGRGVVEAMDVLSFDGNETMETHLMADHALRLIAALPEAQRETAFLVYANGMAYREAAELLDVPIGTVMSRLAAARLALGRQMAGDKAGTRAEVPHHD